MTARSDIRARAVSAALTALCLTFLVVEINARAGEPRRNALQPSASLIASASENAKPGDLLFKQGSGLWGPMAARFSHRDKRFGHVGVVARGADGALIVIHAGGDPVAREGRVQAVDFAAFLRAATAAGLYRPVLENAARAAMVDYAKRAAADAVPFDRDFSLATEDTLYCTELVWRALSHGLGRDAIPAKSRRGGRDYIALDDVQSAATLIEVWSVAS